MSGSSTLKKFRQHRCEFLNPNQKHATRCIFSAYAARIRRTPFAMTCYIAQIYVATSYREKLSQKIVQCNVSLIMGRVHSKLSDCSNDEEQLTLFLSR